MICLPAVCADAAPVLPAIAILKTWRGLIWPMALAVIGWSRRTLPVLGETDAKG